MAVRFRHSMYWSWIDDGETRAMIGFSREDEGRASAFRDALALCLCRQMGWAVRKEEGSPASSDTHIVLYDKCDADQIERHYSRRVPGPFQRLLRTASYRTWEGERASIGGLVKAEIETNHDFPGVLVYSTAVTPEQMRAMIEQVARVLGLELCENRQLENLSIYSNATLACDCHKGT